MKKPDVETRTQLMHARLEISRLQRANLALTQRLVVANEQLQCHLPCPLAKLPYEILLIVFRYALPPAWLLSGDASLLPPFPQSIWSVDLRTKLSIVAVCKIWHQLGLKLFYESVTLRRIGQIPAFLRTLEEREGLGAFVRRLEIGCFVPTGYAALHDCDTTKILLLCPRLSHFAFNPPSNIPLGSCPIPDIVASITSFEWSGNVDYWLVLPSLLRLAPTLRSLALTLPSDFDDAHPLLNLPNLEDLRLRVTPDSDGPGAASRWLMPQLRRIWIHGNSSTHMHRFDPGAIVHNFLDVFGRTISFLRVLDYTSSSSIQGMLDRCPVLNHVALPRKLHENTSLLKHPNVQAVDIFGSLDEHLSITFEALKGGFPELRTFRTMDGSLSFLWDVPAVDATTDWNIDLINKIGVNASVWDINSEDETEELGESAWIAAVLSTDIDSDDSDDDDYLSNADDDDGGSVDGSGTDSSEGELTDYGADDDYSQSLRQEFYLRESLEIGHAEALNIFGSS
ncbi:hypothetical protein C8R43DRAFT_499868 [Mycena crocata]|nr:hypothetical protein C8R43DRAFT_499868 [Mycena crocata]